MFFLSEADVNRVITAFGADLIMDRLTAGIIEGFRSIARGEIVQSKRTGFANDGNLIEWMPVRDETNNTVMKIVSYFPKNPEQYALPTISAVIARIDSHRGQITEIVDGRLLTAMRTAAASAVASRRLATANSATLGLIGCGLQSVTQAHALCRIFPIRRLLAFDIDREALASLPKRLSFLGLPIHAVDTDEIERGSDIICTATSVPAGAQPVLKGRNLRRHVHINAVGSDFPGKIELPSALTKSAFVAADYLDQARVEGECQNLTEEQVASPRCAELHTVITNPNETKHLRNEQTIFDSTGIAMEDAVALDLICKLARQAGIGSDFRHHASNSDPKNPYDQIQWPKFLRTAAP
jgi:ornithine cyclodeaminase/alanine dehydrogenase-like protein (mu-crystallin family)